MKKQIEYLLYNSGDTIVEISKFTDISVAELRRYINGELKGSDRQRVYEFLLMERFEDLWERYREAHGFIDHNDTLIVITKAPEPVLIDGELFTESLGLDEEGNTHPILWEYGIGNTINIDGWSEK